MASQSVQPFLEAHYCDKQTDRQTTLLGLHGRIKGGIKGFIPTKLPKLAAYSASVVMLLI